MLKVLQFGKVIDRNTSTFEAWPYGKRNSEKFRFLADELAKLSRFQGSVECGVLSDLLDEMSQSKAIPKDDERRYWEYLARYSETKMIPNENLLKKQEARKAERKKPT